MNKLTVSSGLAIDKNVLSNWQITADLLAEVSGAAAALIMRVHEHEIEVFVSSRGGIYPPGAKESLNTGLYCEAVIKTQCRLLVPNALNDPEWERNPDIRLGMISYCGLPLTWPNGEIFGTLCILDTKENAYTRQTHQIMERFGDSIKLNLANIYTTFTALREAELDRKFSEEMLRAFYELDLVGLTITSPEKGWIRINDCLCKILEYSEPELRKMTWAELTHPEDLAADEAQFNRLLTNEIDGYSLEKRFISRSNKIIHTHLVVRCVRKNNGDVDYVVAMVEDISERKRIEAEVRAASLYARSLIETSLDPLVTISAEGKITDVNEATVQATGVPREQLTGSDFSGYFTAPEKAQAGYLEAFAKGLVKDHPLTLRHVSGKLTEVLYNASVYRNENGEVVGVFAAARDMTDLRQAEERLLITQFSVDSSADAIFWVKPDGSFSYANKAACSLLGYSYQEILQLKTSNLNPEHQGATWQSHWNELRQQRFLRFETALIRKDSVQIPVEITANHVRFSDQEYNCASVRDISERKRAEKALLISEAQYRLLYESVPVMNFTLDEEGEVLNVNQFGAEQLGYSARELIGQAVFNFFLDEDVPVVHRQLKECFQHPEQVFEWNLRKIHKNGHLLWVHETARVQEKNGRAVLFVACQNISDLKLAEAELRKEKKALQEIGILFKAISENSPMMIILLSDLESEQYRYVNPALTWLFGYTTDEIPSVTAWWQIAYPDAAYREQVKQEWQHRISVWCATSRRKRRQKMS